jgi:ABC-type branched-subunit amino acid transport system ATPase component/ABC-type branched-subunit amino acid transport system permease subunit
VSVAPTRGVSARVWRLVRAGAPLVVICVILAILPALLPDYLQDVMTKALIYGIFAMSLDLLLGYTGLFSLGHAAFLGVGAYTAGMLMVRWNVPSLWIGLGAAAVIGALVAAVFGLLALRVRGVYFLLVTFALGQLGVAAAQHWEFLSPIGSGTQGIIGIGLPSISFSSAGILTPSQFYFVVAAATVVSLIAFRRFLATPLGYAAQGVREGESRMRAFGFNTWTVQYRIYIIGGMFAALAGVFLSYSDGIAVPDTFGVEVSTLVLLMVLIGGSGTLYGPLVGAVLLTFGEYYVSTAAPERWPLILGALFVVTIMFARQGIVVKALQLWTGRPVFRPRHGAIAAPAVIDAPAAATSESAAGVAAVDPRPRDGLASERDASAPAALTVHSLSKSFGGITALRDVSLEAGSGERLAIIGTNGAGKSTLFKIVAGDLRASSGRIALFGKDITRLPAHRRAKLGIGRSFQVTSLLGRATVWMNAWLAVQGGQRWDLQGLRSAERHRDAAARVEALLTEWDLWELRHVVAAELAYGEQRRLEVVAALASEPRLLLMDEPTAGQTMEESQALARHLSRLPRSVTVVVIAHDMDLVFSIADRIVVMHEGRIVADGTGQQIRDDPEVQESYMGMAAGVEPQA